MGLDAPGMLDQPRPQEAAQRLKGALVGRHSRVHGLFYPGMSRGVLRLCGQSPDDPDCARRRCRCCVRWASAGRYRTARGCRNVSGAGHAGRLRARAGVARWIEAREVRNVMVDNGERLGCLSIARGGAARHVSGHADRHPEATGEGGQVRGRRQDRRLGAGAARYWGKVLAARPAVVDSATAWPRRYQVHLGQGSHRRAEVQERLGGQIGKRLDVRERRGLGHGCRRKKVARRRGRQELPAFESSDRGSEPATKSSATGHG